MFFVYYQIFYFGITYTLIAKFLLDNLKKRNYIIHVSCNKKI